MEDNSQRIISDMNHGLDKFAREAKPTRKITLANQKVLEWAHGRQLPLVSNVLVYSKIPRRLPKVQQKALYSLVKGGYIRVLRELGPPTDEDARRESLYADSHYVLYVDQFGAPNRSGGKRLIVEWSRRYMPSPSWKATCIKVAKHATEDGTKPFVTTDDLQESAGRLMSQRAVDGIVDGGEDPLAHVFSVMHALGYVSTGDVWRKR